MSLERASKPRHFWQDLFASGPRDLTQGSIGRNLALLALPTVIQLGLESSFSLIEIGCVSRLGPVSIAAVGFTESWFIVIGSLGAGLSFAISTTVSRRIGERQPEQATAAVGQAISIALGCALLLAIVGTTTAPRLLALAGAGSDVLQGAGAYSRLMLGASGLFVLWMVLNAVLQGAGEAAAAMKGMFLSNLILLVLAPVLVFGLGPLARWGLPGVALAATVARLANIAFQLFHLGAARGRLRLALRHLRPEPEGARKLLRLMSLGALQNLSWTGTWIVSIRLLSGFGTEAVAGFTLALRIFVASSLPAFGIAFATGALVGQNLGAGQADRAERSAMHAAVFNALLLGALGAGFGIAAPSLIGLLTHAPEAANNGIAALRIVGPSLSLFGAGIIFQMSLLGAGDAVRPLYTNLVCYWLLQIPLAVVLSQHTALGAKGVFWAATIANSAMTLISFLLFRAGRWKHQRV